MQKTVFNVYKKMSNDTGVRFNVDHFDKKLRFYAFTLDSNIEGFAEKGQVLYEVRHTVKHWNDPRYIGSGKSMQTLAYSIFWLNPKNQKLLILFLPTETTSIYHSILTTTKEHSKLIRKYFSEPLAVEVSAMRPNFTKPFEGSRMTSEEATNSVMVAREKYREITGVHPDAFHVNATEKFLLFSGDKVPPPPSHDNYRIEVLITEPSPLIPNGILKAMFWIEPTTNANPVVEVLYPVKNYSINPNPHSYRLKPKINTDSVFIKQIFISKDFPRVGKPYNFDLEIGDWVKPYGKGKTTDLIFTTSKRFTHWNNYDFQVTIIVPGEGNGVQEFIPEQLSSSIPETGYNKQIKLYLENSFMTGTSESYKPGRKWIFRTRADFDNKKNVASAFHVLTNDDIKIINLDKFGNFQFVFSYLYNFDPFSKNFEPKNIADKQVEKTQASEVENR